MYKITENRNYSSYFDFIIFPSNTISNISKKNGMKYFCLFAFDNMVWGPETQYICLYIENNLFKNKSNGSRM